MVRVVHLTDTSSCIRQTQTEDCTVTPTSAPLDIRVRKNHSYIGLRGYKPQGWEDGCGPRPSWCHTSLYSAPAPVSGI